MSMKMKLLAALSVAGLAAPVAMSQQQQRTQPGQWDREGAAIVGYDLDRDGQTDAWYYVSTWDFDRMQQENRNNLSSMRGQGQQQFGQQGQQPFGQQQFTQRSRQQDQAQRRAFERNLAMQGNRPMMRQQQAMGPNIPMQFQGQIQDLTTFRFADDGNQHVVARVQLQDGRTIPVHFGLRENIQNVNLSEGKRVTFTGTKGTINDRTVVLADRVRAGNQTIPIQKTHAQNLTRLKGNIQDVRTTTLQGFDQPHTLVRLQTDAGRTVVVDLGPRQNLQDINLRQGKELKVLAHPARINDRQVLMARQVNVDDNIVRISVPRPQQFQQRPMQQRQFQQRQMQQRGGY